MTASSHLPQQGQALPPLIHVTPAQAAGLVRQYDGLTVERMASAVQEQARAEHRAEESAHAAEIAFLQQRITALENHKVKLENIRRALAGRPGDDLVYVDQVLKAADGVDPRGFTPLPLTWDGKVNGPQGDTADEHTLLPCTTSHGGSAVLALTDEQRLRLGGLLLANLYYAEACPTPGCGTPATDLDASDPNVVGWICVDVAGTESGPRWWCGPWCANAALTAAAAELAAADQAAAIDPHQQAPGPDQQHPYGDPLAYGPTGIPCGCGKHAHSNLVPCQPDPVEDDAAAQRTAAVTSLSNKAVSS